MQLCIYVHMFFSSPFTTLKNFKLVRRVIAVIPLVQTCHVL